MINITKGMADAAETIQANFQEVKISAGTNANGEWLQFGAFAKVARGEITFTKPGGYVVGDEIVFDIESPIEMTDAQVFLQPFSYNGSSSFAMYDLETHMINKWTGAIVVRRMTAGTTEIVLQFLIVGV